ncbi:MAG: TIGR02217 family protein [Paracoccaceae bacterium]
MAFHEVRFPTALSFGSAGGPERRTEIVTLSNGFEERNTPWAHSRRRYDAGLGLRSLDDLEQVVAFFEARRGQLYGFRWKDWTDFKSCAPSAQPTPFDQIIATGDGQTLAFPLVKNYRSGGELYARLIAKPVAGSASFGVGGDAQQAGANYTLDLNTGIVTFLTPPPVGAEVTAGFEFDVPVRFDTDRIETSVASFSAGEIPSVPVVEVRV